MGDALGTAPTVGTQTIDLDGELLSLAGTATIDVFGFFTGQFIFTVDSTTVSATVGAGGGVNSLVGAQLTTLSLELDGSDVTIGPASGPHLVIHDGTKLAVAVLKPATPAVGATFTDTRAWIGVKATEVGASLEGIDGLTLSITGGSFSYNSASGAHDDNGAAAGGTVTTATALTWATALGTAPTVGTQTIDLDGELLSLAGTATIDVFGFFTGQFIFTVDSTTVSATVGTGGGVNSLVGAQLTTLSLELDGSDVTIGPASGPHLVIHDGTKLAVAVLKPATPAVGATFTDTRAWIGVKATEVGASLEGIDGLTLSITGGSFSYNSASGAHDDNGAAAGGTVTTATALKWASALGTAPTVGTQTIDLDGELLSLAGTATIDVFGFFTGQFIFTVDSTTVSATVGTGGGVDIVEWRAADDLVARARRFGCHDRPREWSASGDPRRDQARRRRPEARNAGCWGDVYRHEGMDRREGDRGRRVTGGHRRA